MQNAKYWQGRWERGETGWHQKEVEPALAREFRDLAPTRVLVPLCGKSRDLEWLGERGHEVIGVDVSGVALRAFFAERGIRVETAREGEFQVHRGGRLTLFEGDFFALRPEQLGGRLGAVYDRAALIALAAELRPAYAAQLRRLIGAPPAPGFQFLEIQLEREPHDDTGPPYSVPEAELLRHYGETFAIRRVSRESVEAKAPPGSRTYETVYRLTPKGA